MKCRIGSQVTGLRARIRREHLLRPGFLREVDRAPATLGNTSFQLTHLCQNSRIAANRFLIRPAVALVVVSSGTGSTHGDAAPGALRVVRHHLLAHDAQSYAFSVGGLLPRALVGVYWPIVRPGRCHDPGCLAMFPMLCHAGLRVADRKVATACVVVCPEVLMANRALPSLYIIQRSPKEDRNEHQLHQLHRTCDNKHQVMQLYN